MGASARPDSVELRHLDDPPHRLGTDYTFDRDELASGEVGVSTTNRNFIGKVGKGSHTYLMSPMSAMATAVRGVITDPRDILG